MDPTQLSMVYQERIVGNTLLEHIQLCVVFQEQLNKIARPFSTTAFHLEPKFPTQNYSQQ